eukprot:6187917-Pleurochrysis_carterae.AAC.1
MEVSLHPDAWDDTELIRAYDRAVSQYKVKLPPRQPFPFENQSRVTICTLWCKASDVFCSMCTPKRCTAPSSLAGNARDSFTARSAAAEVSCWICPIMIRSRFLDQEGSSLRTCFPWLVVVAHLSDHGPSIASPQPQLPSSTCVHSNLPRQRDESSQGSGASAVEAAKRKLLLQL